MVEQWVKDIVEEVGGPSQMEIGKELRHPDGRTVRIVSGRFWGERGVSNWWTWREVLGNGELGPEESGYGW